MKQTPKTNIRKVDCACPRYKLFLFSSFSGNDEIMLFLLLLNYAGLCVVPTADPINSINSDQATVYWSGSVGMHDREWSGRSTLVGITGAFHPKMFDM